jgi:serine/threonine protein phosphatase PrpC
VFCRPTFTVLAISDGVSGADESHWGSALLTRQLQAEFDRVFPNSYTSDVAAWADLSTGLSQKLVAAYVSKMRQEGKEYPRDIEKLRGAAAARYASTLEILVVDLEYLPTGSKYLHVRIAGDGGLFVVNGSGVESALDQTQSKSSDGTVFALPIHDGEPEIRGGVLARGSSLVMGTDGVSEHIKSTGSWQSALVTTLNSGQLSESALLDLVSLNVAEAGDDRTIVTVRNVD